MLVSLGETKVLAQVTSEITQPRATRPAEGILHINVNSGQIRRSAEQIVLLTRNLERALKESRCVDLESLCIKAEEKVWSVRVDVNILNHEGNLTGKFGGRPFWAVAWGDSKDSLVLLKIVQIVEICGFHERLGSLFEMDFF